MSEPVLLDTGPLVAFLDRRDEHHRWAYKQFGELPFPFFTCEAVLTEASHLLHRAGADLSLIFNLLHSGALQVAYAIQPESQTLQALLTQYRNVPMDLADACLVRMAENYRECRILTVDSDFFVYRTQTGKALDVIAPN